MFFTNFFNTRILTLTIFFNNLPGLMRSEKVMAFNMFELFWGKDQNVAKDIQSFKSHTTLDHPSV